MKRQRYGKVFPREDMPSHGFRQRSMKIPSADLWTTPYSYRRHDPEGSEVVLRDSENKFQDERSTSNKDSIHIVVVPFIFLGQCFGLLPVNGVLNSPPENLTFSWFSMKVFYAVLLISLNLVLTFEQIYSAATVHGFSYFSIDNIISSSLTTVHMVIFLQQARTWPALMSRWTRVEGHMRHFHPLVGFASTVHSFVYVFAVCVFFLVVARLTTTLTMVYDCSDSLLSAVRLALLANYNVMPVSPAVAPVKVLLLALLFVQENFVLVFDELTIMVLTYSLALRFRQLNGHLQKVCRQRLPAHYWAELRVTYNSLSNLAQHLNSHLSWMTLVCFGASLYDICALLHLILSPVNQTVTNWAILYVLVFSVLRTFSAALVASSVSEDSKRPMYEMFSVPSESYGAEVCRFQMQVTHSDIAITGLDFFSVTRSFMLTVAGTIATYEIVLIQFGTSSGQNETSSNITDSCYNLVFMLDQ